MTKILALLRFNQRELWYCPTCACHHENAPCMPLRPSER